MKTAIVIGATGLTGSLLTRMLLESDYFRQVDIFVRRDSGMRHEKLTQHIVDFDNPDSYSGLIEGDNLFCCMGTTIKNAGSEEEFEKVDLVYPVEFAKAAQKNGVKHFFIISSIGANSDSSNFYLRTKGRCEDKIIKIPFRCITIFRPSLLTGERNEFRMGEKVSAFAMKIASVFLIGKLRKYRPVKASKVAQAMCKAATNNLCGVNIIESDAIQKM